MEESTARDVLKSAILLERRGKAFYATVAEQTSVQAVKDFFGMMADEEEKHVQVLSDQYRSHQAGGAFTPPATDEHPSGAFVSEVLTERLKREVSAADFEAAAIAAAMSMEKNAIRVYSERAEGASDPGEKALYRWLADWEAEHLDFLAKVDREITEAAWNDSRFWPF